jgi:hypothetical protein
MAEIPAIQIIIASPRRQRGNRALLILYAQSWIASRRAHARFA